jgi:hypothetical protein
MSWPRATAGSEGLPRFFRDRADLTVHTAHGVHMDSLPVQCRLVTLDLVDLSQSSINDMHFTSQTIHGEKEPLSPAPLRLRN